MTAQSDPNDGDLEAPTRTDRYPATGGASFHGEHLTATFSPALEEAPIATAAVRTPVDDQLMLLAEYGEADAGAPRVEVGVELEPDQAEALARDLEELAAEVRDRRDE